MIMEKVRLDWERCITFHGHICPGLAIGFQATQLGLRLLQERDLAQENPINGIVSIVQNDACGVDAVQVLTGCTFGKGNLLFIDHGKQVYRFVRSQDGRGIRIALKHGAMDNETHHLLRNKVVEKTATPDEAEEFIKLHREIALRLVEASPEDYFKWQEIKIDLPKGPQLNPTVQCAFCGEGVMEQRAHVRDGIIACPECTESYESRVLVLNK